MPGTVVGLAVGHRQGKGAELWVARKLRDQTVISFQASTLDWSATTVFQEEVTESLNDVTDGSSFSASLSGRSLILAQITADVAEAAVVSTSVVAGVILFDVAGNTDW